MFALAKSARFCAASASAYRTRKLFPPTAIHREDEEEAKTEKTLSKTVEYGESSMNYHSMHMNGSKKMKTFWNKRVINHKIILLKMIIRRRKVHSCSIIYQFLSVFVCAGEGSMLRSQELFLCAALKLSLLKIFLKNCLAAFHLAKRSVAAEVTRTHQRARLRFPIIFFNFILPSDRREA